MTNAPRVVIFGRRGFIGSALTDCLTAHGYSVTGVTRSPTPCSVPRVSDVWWDASTFGDWTEAVSGAVAVINVTGENLASGFWTRSKRNAIRDSRLHTTDLIVEALLRCPVPPRVFCQGSAIGYYGISPAGRVTESSPSGSGFLAEIVGEVERRAARAGTVCRTHLLRTGIVLGRTGGYLHAFTLPFRIGLGAYVGNSDTRVSWIHLLDEARAIAHLIDHETSGGPLNLVAPAPVRLGDLAESVARRMNRRVWLRVPPSLLAWLPGRMSEELFMGSPDAASTRLQDTGFQFEFPNLDTALDDLFDTRLPV